MSTELKQERTVEQAETMAPQAQQLSSQPGRETEVQPAPLSFAHNYRGSGKLVGKVALITGGDSGIGRSTAIAFAKEGADIVFAYLDEHEDAALTREAILKEGAECQAFAGDIGDPEVVRELVEQTVAQFGRIDVLVNNAAEQHPKDDIADVRRSDLEKTFRTNFFAMFELCQRALPHMPEGGAIVNTSSVTAYRGSDHLLDYSASKGAIVAFTRSLAQQLAERRIRVNAVAPGPVWTALIPSTFDAEEVAEFGKKTPLERPAQPDEISPCYVFLASADSSYMTGQVLHPNGGEIVNA